MTKLISISWFFTYWAALFFQIAGTILIAKMIIEKISKESKQPNVRDRKTKYFLLIVLILTMLIAFKLVY